jgi:hypothetical protein
MACVRFTGRERWSGACTPSSRMALIDRLCTLGGVLAARRSAAYSQATSCSVDGLVEVKLMVASSSKSEDGKSVSVAMLAG